MHDDPSVRPPRIADTINLHDLAEKSVASESSIVGVDVKTAAASDSLRSGWFHGRSPTRSHSSKPPATSNAVLAASVSRGRSSIGTCSATWRNCAVLRE